MEDILSEPVELINSDLDEVAGGSFGNVALASVAQAVTNVGFNIGQVTGSNVGLNLGTVIS